MKRFFAILVTICLFISLLVGCSKDVQKYTPISESGYDSACSEYDLVKLYNESYEQQGEITKEYKRVYPLPYADNYSVWLHAEKSEFIVDRGSEIPALPVYNIYYTSEFIRFNSKDDALSYFELCEETIKANEGTAGNISSDDNYKTLYIKNDTLYVSITLTEDTMLILRSLSPEYFSEVDNFILHVKSYDNVAGSKSPIDTPVKKLLEEDYRNYCEGYGMREATKEDCETEDDKDFLFKSYYSFESSDCKTFLRYNLLESRQYEDYKDGNFIIYSKAFIPLYAEYLKFNTKTEAKEYLDKCTKVLEGYSGVLESKSYPFNTVSLNSETSCVSILQSGGSIVIVACSDLDYQTEYNKLIELFTK